MKLLLDACVSKTALNTLLQAGYDVDWVGNWTKDPGDVEVLTFANQHNRVLITLDKDFGELAIVRNMPHYGIVRLSGIASKEQGRVCVSILNDYKFILEKGAIITADLKKIRVRFDDGDN